MRNLFVYMDIKGPLVQNRGSITNAIHYDTIFRKLKGILTNIFAVSMSI